MRIGAREARLYNNRLLDIVKNMRNLGENMRILKYTKLYNYDLEALQ